MLLSISEEHTFFYAQHQETPACAKCKVSRYDLNGISRFAAPPYHQLSPASVRRFFALEEQSFNETRREKNSHLHWMRVTCMVHRVCLVIWLSRPIRSVVHVCMSSSLACLSSGGPPPLLLRLFFLCLYECGWFVQECCSSSVEHLFWSSFRTRRSKTAKHSSTCSPS